MNANPAYLEYIYNEGLYLLDEPIQEVPAESVDATEVSINKLEQSPIKYLGANEKGAVFIVSDPSHEFINSKDHGFLMKIVESGLRMSKFDIAIINIANQPFERILDEIPCQYIVGFDIPELVSTTTDFNYVVQEMGGKKILSVDALTVIEANVDKKRMLWNALQVMFDIQKSKN